MQSNTNIVEPNDQGELDLGSPMSVGRNSNSNLYDWELEKCESYKKYCWTIESILKHQVHTCYSISLVPKNLKKKIKECPTLIPTNTRHTNIPIDSLAMHINDLSKNIGEQGCLQSLIKTFTGQVACWWGTHQSQLQRWKMESTYFVKQFGGKKLTSEAKINKFHPRDNPIKYIDLFQKEWK